MNTETKDHGRENAKRWFESIQEMVAALDTPDWEAAAEEAGWEPYIDNFGVACWRDLGDGATFAGTAEQLCDAHCIGAEYDHDAAVERIQESALSVEVRGPWCGPGDALNPVEYRLLLTTGGPALRLTGDLTKYGEPENARLEYQDSGTPWTVWHPWRDLADAENAQATLLAFAQQFYFGE